jgi:hypothetical protein
MSAKPPRGCLAALFGHAGETRTPSTGIPSYRVRADFLSVTELSFMRVAQIAVLERFVIVPKVNLADLFFSPTSDPVDRNRISQKHLDFLCCDRETFRPVLGIELDDSSHQRAARIERDAFVDAVFASAGLPLLRLPARQSYSSGQIAAAIDEALLAAATNLDATAAPGAPTCRSCGTAMVVRTASKGPHAGSAFYGCPNYPRCREMRPITNA